LTGLALGVNARLLGLTGWLSRNIVGNRVVQGLAGPGAFK